MNIIEQTNRTILYDQLNPEKLDLITLIGDVKGDTRDLESVDDDKVSEINRYCECGSFEEVLDKFEPVIYSFFNAANQQVIYTDEKPTAVPDDCIQTIPIDMNNDFLKMLITMIQKKRAEGIENVDFNFENVLDMISPKKVMDDIKQVRKEIHYLYGEYEQLEDKNPLKKDIGAKLNKQFQIARESYSNIMAMLPLAIDDSKQRLLAGQSGDGADGSKFVAGRLTMTEDGELKIIERPKSESTELALTDSASSTALAVRDIFQEDYEETSEDQQNDYAKELVLRTFAPLSVIEDGEIDYPAEVKKYNNYLQFYQQTKGDFIKVVKPLIEKLLGIYVFFDQYHPKTPMMRPKLLITNCKLDMLTKATNLKRLQVYLNTVNNKNDFRNTIWYGIVNNVEFKKESKVKVTRKIFEEEEANAKSDLTSMSTLASILDGTLDYNIQTFFGFETCEETSFTQLAVNGVDEFIDKTRSLQRREFSEYAIPCLPNMSVVPKNKSGLIIDTLMIATDEGAKISDERTDILKLFIEGVYIPASFVAAGVMAACQCPQFLKTKFDNVDNTLPGVRFDLEAGDNALRVPTTLGKEISGFTNKIKEAINVSGFGFTFSSDNNMHRGKEIKQITVYKARSLQVLDSGDFDAVYKTQVTTYVNRMLRAQTSDFKSDNVSRFFSASPNSQKSQWFANRDSINSIAYQGDDMTCEIRQEHGICNVELTFGGNTKNLEIRLNRKAAAV